MEYNDYTHSTSPNFHFFHQDLSHTLSQPWITVNNASEDASGANVHSQVQVHANGSLSIDQLTKTSGGNYTCRVRNRHGEDSISHFRES